MVNILLLEDLLQISSGFGGSDVVHKIFSNLIYLKVDCVLHSPQSNGDYYIMISTLFLLCI